MKTRNGFVSNSSSSSFVMKSSVLTDGQKELLMNYIDDPDQNVDGWNVVIDIQSGLIHGYTSMDNGDFDKWLFQNRIEGVVFDDHEG